MNSDPETIPIKRYIALDLHKHYIMVGGQNQHQEWVLRPRKIQMHRFGQWAAQNLRPGDAVVIETTGNSWDIYDIVAPLVKETKVAHAGKVRQIAEARVKTDSEDIRRLLTVLIGNILPAHFCVGDRTSVFIRRHLSYLLSRLSKLSRDETPDGSLPIFMWSDVAFGSTPIHTITAWPSLFPSSHATAGETWDVSVEIAWLWLACFASSAASLTDQTNGIAGCSTNETKHKPRSQKL